MNYSSKSIFFAILVAIFIVCSISEQNFSNMGGLDDLTNFTDQKMFEVLGLDIEGVKERLDKIFQIIDSNKDNVLDDSELENWASFVKNEVFLKQVQVEMKQIDTDSDGFISLDELNEAFAQNLDEKEIEKHSSGLLKRFQIVDKDNDNKLNIHEVGLLIDPGRDEQLKELEISEILEHHDLNKDGKISLEEFKQTRSDDSTNKKDDEAMAVEDFNFFDANKDGFIDRDEIIRIYFDPAHETGAINIKELKSNIFEDKEITFDLWKEKALKIAITSLTDFGDIIRYPEDFKLDIGKNVVLPSTKTSEDDDVEGEDMNLESSDEQQTETEQAPSEEEL